MNLPQPKHRIRHLLMDLDGTLIHSGSFLIHLDFIGRIMPVMKQHRGWRAAWNGLKGGFEALKAPPNPTSKLTNHVRLVNIFKEHLNLDFADAERHLAAALMDVFPKLKSHFGEIPGANKFVEWARDHYTLTLATNPVWLPELVHMRMRWGGIDPKDFNSITTSDRMHACKPYPEYFAELLAQENFKPEDCLFIGNDRKMDLPAMNVGIPAFLLRPDAKVLRCIVPPSESSPGAWRGNYTHLKELLQKQS